MCSNGIMARRIEFRTTCKPVDTTQTAQTRSKDIGSPGTRNDTPQPKSVGPLTWHTGNEPQRSQHPKRSQRLHIQADIQMGQSRTQHTDENDEKIEHIPAVPQIGALMHHKAERDNLHKALGRKDDEKYVLDILQGTVRDVRIAGRIWRVNGERHAIGEYREEDHVFVGSAETDSEQTERERERWLMVDILSLFPSVFDLTQPTSENMYEFDSQICMKDE